MPARKKVDLVEVLADVVAAPALDEVGWNDVGKASGRWVEELSIFAGPQGLVALNRYLNLNSNARVIASGQRDNQEWDQGFWAHVSNGRWEEDA